MRPTIEIDSKIKIQILKDVFKTATKNLEEKIQRQEMSKVDDDLSKAEYGNSAK